MISNERRTELYQLTKLASVAGEDYYVKLDEKTWEKFYEENKGNPMYNVYAYQREVGFDAYAEEIKGRIAKEVTTPEELGVILSFHNFDDGKFTLYEILHHPLCSITTAKEMYWLLEPTYYYDEYGNLDKAPKVGYESEDVKLLQFIEEKATKGEFGEAIEPLEDSVLYDIELEDGEYEQIPAVLREF